jgi:TolB protein
MFAFRRMLGPAVVFGVLLLAAARASAPEVYLSITKGFGEKVFVAVPLFHGTAGTASTRDIRSVLSADLTNSGYFSVVENLAFVDETEADDRRAGRVAFAEWLTLGAEVLVKGDVAVNGQELTLEAQVYDVGQGRAIFSRRYVSEPNHWRAAVHELADDIVNHLTGEQGIARSKIAFVSNVTGTKEIYTMDYDGENVRRLTKDGLAAMYPAWFSDNSTIAYTRYRGNGQETAAINVGTGVVRKLTAFPGLNAFIGVSAKGNELAMTLSRDGNPEIYRLRSDGSEPRRLTYGSSTESSPSWSPDGRRVAFVSDRSGSPQIYVMSAAGGSEERMTYRGSYNTSPDWSPKGDLIAYTARVDGIFQICTVDVETKDVVRLTTGGENKEDPSWAADGRHLVYSVRSHRKSDLYMLDIYDLVPVRLTSGAGDHVSPAWSH